LNHPFFSIQVSEYRSFEYGNLGGITHLKPSTQGKATLDQVTFDLMSFYFLYQIHLAELLRKKSQLKQKKITGLLEF
jgi:hypothetical protein